MAAAVKCCIEAWPEARYIVKESVPGYEKGIRRGGWGRGGDKWTVDADERGGDGMNMCTS